MNSLTSFNICFYSELKMKRSTTHHPLAIKNTIHLNAIMYEKKTNIVLCKRDLFFFQLCRVLHVHMGQTVKNRKSF